MDAGVSFFLDLTEEDEGLEPYELLLLEEAAARGRTVAYHRLAIPDLDTPTTERMSEIQRIIAEDAPYVFLFYQKTWSGQNKRIGGIDPKPVGITWNSLDWHILEDPGQ